MADQTGSKHERFQNWINYLRESGLQVDEITYATFW